MAKVIVSTTLEVEDYQDLEDFARRRGLTHGNGSVNQSKAVREAVKEGLDKDDTSE